MAMTLRPDQDDEKALALLQFVYGTSKQQAALRAVRDTAQRERVAIVEKLRELSASIDEVQGTAEERVASPHYEAFIALVDSAAAAGLTTDEMRELIENADA